MSRNDTNLEMLVVQKKREINQLIWNLLTSRTITGILNASELQKSLFFTANIDKKLVELKFIIWTDAREKDPDSTDSQRAEFVLHLDESIEDVKQRVLKYLEGIQKGVLHV